MIFVAVCVLSTALNLLFQKKEQFVASGVFKMIAASCYVGLALANGALETLFGTLLLIAFLLSWAGDAFLISRGRDSVFLAGLVAFLLAHLAYGAGFSVRGLDAATAVVTALIMALFGWVILRWLDRNDLSKRMRKPVIAYIAVIGVMVTCAVSTSVYAVSVVIAAGAILFTASDLFVARDRFVKKSFFNVVTGQTLYFTAQLILASSIP